MADEKLELYLLKTKYWMLQGKFLGKKEITYYRIFGSPKTFEYPTNRWSLKEVAKSVAEKIILTDYYISDFDFYFNKPANIPDVELKVHGTLLIENKELSKSEKKEFVKSLEEVLSKHD